MFRRENLRRSGAPAIYSLKHFAATTGVDYGYLRGVIRHNAHAYRAIRIPKNTGGFRDLLSPNESLMHAQRWILHEVLVHIRRHVNNFAYIPGVTARECAARHAGASWMIKTDIHNYFPSISENDVYNVFLDLGYSPLLSFELARLCTWWGPAKVEVSTVDTNQKDSYRQYHTRAPNWVTCRKDHQPAVR